MMKKEKKTAAIGYGEKRPILLIHHKPTSSKIQVSTFIKLLKIRFSLTVSYTDSKQKKNKKKIKKFYKIFVNPFAANLFYLSTWS